MPPKGTRHKQKRTDKKEQQLKRRFVSLDVSDDSGGAQASTSDKATVDEVKTPETVILISKFPLYEKWEELEHAEAQQVTETHTSRIKWLLPEKLPVLVHVACPQNGRFTREIESDIEELNCIEAVKDLVKSSLVFELVRTNIDPTRVRFAGLMCYGPTTEFSTKSIHSFTRGLFLQESAFKKWWLTVDMRQRVPGDMVKIAVVLWDAEEAAVHRMTLPDFWTEPNARILGNHLEKLEMPIWDLDVEKGCRNYVKMQELVQEARIEAANAMKGDWKVERKGLQIRITKLGNTNDRLIKSKDKMTELGDAMANAIEVDDIEEAARLAAEWKKGTKGKGKAKEVVDDDEEGVEEDEESEMDDEDEDPDDKDYDDDE